MENSCQAFIKENESIFFFFFIWHCNKYRSLVSCGVNSTEMHVDLPQYQSNEIPIGEVEMIEFLL